MNAKNRSLVKRPWLATYLFIMLVILTAALAAPYWWFYPMTYFFPPGPIDASYVIVAIWWSLVGALVLTVILWISYPTLRRLFW